MKTLEIGNILLQLIKWYVLSLVFMQFIFWYRACRDELM